LADEIAIIRDLLIDNWNSSNVDNYTAGDYDSGEDVLIDDRLVFPAMLQLSNNDYITLYEASRSVDIVDSMYHWTLTRITISIDIWTSVSRSHLINLYDEVMRIIKGKGNEPYTGYRLLYPVSVVDLSDKSKKTWRRVIDVVIETDYEWRTAI